MKKKNILLLFVLAFAGILTVGMIVFVLKARSTYNPEAARKAGAGVPVKTAKVLLEDVKETIGGNFIVVPEFTVDVKALITSKRAKEVKVKTGSMVREKQLLVTLDDTLFLAALRAAESELRKTETAVENTKLQYERFKELFAKGYATKPQLEEAVLNYKTAEANHSGAVKALQDARNDESNALIYSPIKGVVSDIKIDPGQSVRTNDQLLTIGDIDSVFIVASIAEEKVSRIYLGQDADIVFDSFPNLTVSGKVYKIDPATDPKARTFKVYIRVPNRDHRFTPGLAGYARLDFHFKGLTVPPLAVITNQKESSVFVVENKKARLKRIKPGMELFDKTEVLEGLSQGEEVVFYGQLNLKDGDTVNTEAFKGK